MPNATNDAHVQHTWQLANDTGDEISIDLWTDDYSVRVDGGPDDGLDSEQGRPAIEQLLVKYTAAGYRLVRDYPVNEPHDSDAEAPDDGEPADKPEACPECGSPVEWAQNHVADHRQGDAWLCTGCRWGEWIPTT
jgi:hypothetical protein